MLKKIIIKTYGEKRTIWLSQSYVMELLQITELTLRVRRTEHSKDNKKPWRWQKIENGFYYDYEGVPDRYLVLLGSREALINKAGKEMPLEEVIGQGKEKIFNEMVTRLQDNTALNYYLKQSTISNSVTYKEAEELAEAWHWGIFIIEAKKQKLYISFGFEKIMDFLEACVFVLKDRGLKNFKASSSTSIYNKIKDFEKIKDINESYEYFIHKAFGNENAKIVGTIEIAHPETGEVLPYDVYEALMYYLYMNIGYANKEFKAQIYRDKYKPELEKLNIEHIISYRTFCRYTEMFYHKIKMSNERDGKKYTNDVYKPYVAAHKLEMSNSLWASDGSGTKLRYMHNGKPATFYLTRIYDVASGYLLGYCIEESNETAKGLTQALKMAIDNSNGYAPCDFVSDNGSIYKDGEMVKKLKRLFPVVRNIAIGNSQANPAEMLVKQLTNMCRMHLNWIEEGFNASRIESRANMDKLTFEHLPNREQAYLQVEEIVRYYNHEVKGADGLSRYERYQQNKNPKSQKIGNIDYRFAFGWNTKVDLSYMRGYVIAYKGEKKLMFTIENYEQNIEVISRACGYKGNAQVILKFDEEACDIYTTEEVYIMTAFATKKAHKSHSEAQEGTQENLNTLIKNKENFEQSNAKFVSDVVESVEAMRYEEHLFFKKGTGVKEAHNQQEENRRQEEIKKIKDNKISIEDEAEEDLFF